MNIVMIMAGGAGDRIGSSLPKQYHLIAGKPVIDYVIDACLSSHKTDKIVVVLDKCWINYSENLKRSDFLFADNGNTRLQSMYNGLNLINKNYDCDKIVVVDAVAPFIYSEIIDNYFDLLDEYDAVITSQHITGALTDIHNNELNRDDYIITQSPEGFKFKLLFNNFDVNYKYQETAGMLPAYSKRYYFFGFKNNLKLTYDYELGYAEYMLSKIGKTHNENNIAFFDRNLLVTEGLKSFLIRNESDKTNQWLDDIYKQFPNLISKWSITSFIPNQSSLYGLVLQAESAEYGDVIIKFIPDFVDRYERELEAMKLLPASYMCKLLDYDLDSKSMLLNKVNNARFATFEENIKLNKFFTNVINDAVPYVNQKLDYIPDYYEELKSKLVNIDLVPFLKQSIKNELEYAINLYEIYFKNAKKYILHGDLHSKNVLNDGMSFYGIDPNGFIAPIELECVRFIRNDVREHISFGYSQRYALLLNYFASFVDKKLLNIMFIIDMAFCTYNSVFENSDDTETKVDLELIQIAKSYLKSCENYE